MSCVYGWWRWAYFATVMQCLMQRQGSRWVTPISVSWVSALWSICCWWPGLRLWLTGWHVGDAGINEGGKSIMKRSNKRKLKLLNVMKFRWRVKVLKRIRWLLSRLFNSLDSRLAWMVGVPKLKRSLWWKGHLMYRHRASFLLRMMDGILTIIFLYKSTNKSQTYFLTASMTMIFLQNLIQLKVGRSRKVKRRKRLLKDAT